MLAFIGTDGGLLGLALPAAAPAGVAIVQTRCPSCLIAPIGRNENCPRCMVHHIEHCMFAASGDCHGLAIMRERSRRRSRARARREQQRHASRS